MKPIAIIAIIAAVVVVGGACAGIAFSGVLNGGTTGSGGDDPVVPTDPVDPTPTETPTETPTPTETQMSTFSPMTSSGSSSGSSSSSNTGGSSSGDDEIEACKHENVGSWAQDTDNPGMHIQTCNNCGFVVNSEACSSYENYQYAGKSDAGDHTHNMFCIDCGYKATGLCEPGSTTHSEEDGEYQHSVKCKDCKAKIGESVACFPSDNPDQEGWGWISGTSSHKRTCVDCDETYIAECTEKDGKTPTSLTPGSFKHTMDGECKDCGNPYTGAEVQCFITYEKNATAPHTHDLTCNLCGVTHLIEECKNYTYTKNTEAGKIGTHNVTCTNCSNIINDAEKCEFDDAKTKYYPNGNNPMVVLFCKNCSYTEEMFVEAKIDKKYYKTLEEAISAVQEDQTIEILRPGIYDPFTINKDRVTVKGIVGATKEKSTVIQNTATDRIILGKGTITDDDNPMVKEIHALKSVDGVKLENLWIDSTVAPTFNSWDLDLAIIITPYYEHSNSYATNTIITGCYIEGDGSQTMMMGLGDGLTFTDNIVKNFSTAFYAETNQIKAQKISGNTFEGVKTAMSYVMANGGQADITITDNTVVDTTEFNLWDYAQWQNRNSTASVSSAFESIDVSGNDGNINYVLNHFNYKAVTPYSISLGSGTQKIINMSGVAFDISSADKANYIIKNTDGTDLTSATQGRNTLTYDILVDGEVKGAVYTIAPGDYLLVNITSNVKYAFTVTDPVEGKQQYVKLDTIAITDADDMFKFADMVNNEGKTFKGMTVKLMNDIDLEDKEWTPIGQTGEGHVTFHGVFDGNEKTISNFKVDRTSFTEWPDSAGLFGWVEGHADPIVIKDLIIKNANINGNYFAGGIVGYINGDGAHVIQNCHVVDSTIQGGRKAEQVGGIVGHLGHGRMTDCSVTNSQITCYGTGQWDTVGELVGWIAAVSTVDESNTYSGVTITGTKQTV